MQEGKKNKCIFGLGGGWLHGYQPAIIKVQRVTTPSPKLNIPWPDN